MPGALVPRLFLRPHGETALILRWSKGPHGVATAGEFQLDHLRSHLGQHGAVGRAKDEGRKVNHPDHRQEFCLS